MAVGELECRAIVEEACELLEPLDCSEDALFGIGIGAVVEVLINEVHEGALDDDTGGPLHESGPGVCEANDPSAWVTRTALALDPAELSETAEHAGDRGAGDAEHLDDVGLFSGAILHDGVKQIKTRRSELWVVRLTKPTMEAQRSVKAALQHEGDLVHEAAVCTARAKTTWSQAEGAHGAVLGLDTRLTSSRHPVDTRLTSSATGGRWGVQLSVWTSPGQQHSSVKNAVATSQRFAGRRIRVNSARIENMRFAILSAACLVILPLACGGDDSTTMPTPDSGGSDTSADQASGDGSKPDGGDSSVMTDGDGKDANGFDVVIPDANLACTDPSTCNGLFCCGDLVLGAGNPPQCPINSISSSCTKTCNTKLAFMCSTTEKVRFCGKIADCAGDQASPDCCTFKQNMQTITFCTTKQIAQIGGGTCL